MLTPSQYLQLINEAIASIPYPQDPSQLYEPIAYAMGLGGKRIRPVLTLMSCEAMGGKAQDALDVAVGVELFHNFTLLHDDVMDQADMRRGKPTVHRRWNANTAILSGDTMLTMAAQWVARADDAHLRRVVEMFNRTAIEVYEGQQMDMDYEHRNDVTEDEYIAMIRLKTSVLLGCACYMGAILANASDADAQALYDFGVNLGLAFQLQDDQLDVWGDPATFGKEIGGDIMNNKKTFLLIHAMHDATGDDAIELRRWLADPYAIRDEKVPAVRALYERLGLREKADEAIAHYNQLAIDALGQVHITDEAREALTALACQLVKRNR